MNTINNFDHKKYRPVTLHTILFNSHYYFHNIVLLMRIRLSSFSTQFGALYLFMKSEYLTLKNFKSVETLSILILNSSSKFVNHDTQKTFILQNYSCCEVIHLILVAYHPYILIAFVLMMVIFSAIDCPFLRCFMF